MARRILAWQCRYCGVIKKSETICERHERTCLKNPDARNCIVCEHSFKPTVEFLFDEEPACSLMCHKGKVCSRATSAKCEYFKRRKED